MICTTGIQKHWWVGERPGSRLHTYIGKSELYRIRFFGLLLTFLLCQSKSHSIQLIFFLKIPSQDLYNLGNETSIGHIRYDVVVYVQKQLAVNDG